MGTQLSRDGYASTKNSISATFAPNVANLMKNYISTKSLFSVQIMLFKLHFNQKCVFCANYDVQTQSTLNHAQTIKIAIKGHFLLKARGKLQQTNNSVLRSASSVAIRATRSSTAESCTATVAASFSTVAFKAATFPLH